MSSTGAHQCSPKALAQRIAASAVATSRSGVKRHRAMSATIASTRPAQGAGLVAERGNRAVQRAGALELLAQRGGLRVEVLGEQLLAKAPDCLRDAGVAARLDHQIALAVERHRAAGDVGRADARD